MSYILDALKKAEAEREGAAQAPLAQGSHAPHTAPAQGLPRDAAPAPAKGTQPLVWMVGGLSVALAGVTLGWLLFGRSAPEPVQMADAGAQAVSPGAAWTPASPEPEPEPVTPTTSNPASPSPPATQAPAPNEPAAQAEPEQPPVDEPVRMRPPSREALQDETPPPVMQFSTIKPRVPAPVPAATAEASRRPAAAATSGRQTTTTLASAPPAIRRDTARETPRPATTVTASAPATAAEPPRVYALHELPPNIRQQLPQLSVGGAMYSESPASRMLILNGQPFKEGDQPIAHLKLEQINLKSAVLSYKGYRYAINY